MQSQPFVLDADVVSCPTNLAILRRIAALVNECFYETGGRILVLPVSIGGCSYVPPIPTEDGISSLIVDTIEDQASDTTTRGVRLCLRLMRAQPFIDGNKRTAAICANHYLIAQGGRSARHTRRGGRTVPLDARRLLREQRR